MADSPNKGKGAVVRCSVYSEGSPIAATFRLVSVNVYKAVNRIGKANITFEAGDMPSSSFPESDNDTFAIGKTIRIEAGYDQEEAPIFEGTVTSHKVRILKGNKATLDIECRDHAFATTMERRNNIFSDSTDSDAIKKIMGTYSHVSPTVDATATKHTKLVQYYCTDWDFILSRAEINGLVIITEGSAISIKKPALDKEAVLTVKYGTDLIEFDGELRAGDQVAQLEAFAWDPASQQIISAKGNAPTLNDQGVDAPSNMAKAIGGTTQRLQTSSAVDKESLTSWAGAMLLRTGLSRIQGDITFCGSSKAIAGATIELDGFGKHFDGNAYIGAVEHNIADGDWTTTAAMGMETGSIADLPNVISPPASGLLPGIHGLHIGKVVKLDEDPLKNNLIKVEIPILAGDDNTVWARLANQWASNGYGSFFIPDIGDEVAVGFFNGDPCYPVILGSLYSTPNPPPYELTADNNTRAIVTREKMKLIFDEEKKVITVETPGNNRIEINDDKKAITITDQNGNSVELSDSGIGIKSAKDITIKADQKIKIEAGAAIEVKAATDLKMKGMNIELKADAGLTAKGTATAELSASGNTTIKGAMVMIN